jgi:bacillithiol system protein YtxJ
MSASFRSIDSIEELDTLFERSSTEPVVIFKHSNSCGTSAYVFEIMSEVTGEIHLVTVQERRDISNAIADRTRIRHQTPQAFVIANGEIEYSASHYNISPEAINDMVSKLSTRN